MRSGALAAIKHYVTEGRREIVGGFWVQPDCNIPAGESFVRHALYAKAYFQQRFGIDVQVGYNVDSFGANENDSRLTAECCNPNNQIKRTPLLLSRFQFNQGIDLLLCQLLVAKDQADGLPDATQPFTVVHSYGQQVTAAHFGVRQRNNERYDTYL